MGAGSRRQNPKRADDRSHCPVPVIEMETGQQEQDKEATGTRTRRQISGRIQVIHNGAFSAIFRFQWVS